MARIDIKSAGATLSDGVLQLENGVMMDTTLRNVADQNNTTSPLKLSTTAVQVVSPLRITTDDPSDMYLDCEDGSANNRFNITRNTASQQVNLNFASNPAGSTTTVGAIRTFTDGVNLGEVVKFREDGQVTFTERVNVEADSLVTTQSSSVIAASTTNASLVIAPNGTGALVADIPDGTVTGGNARGNYAVDLQLVRLNANQVASGAGAFASGGENISSAIYTTAMGNVCVASGNYSFAVGLSSTASGLNSVSLGRSNVASSQYSTVSGGQSNTASTNTHATVVGGQSNTSSGQYSVSGGFTNTASGESAVTLGRNNIASSIRGVSIGDNNNNSTSRGVAIGHNNTVSQSGGNFYAGVIGEGNSVTAGQQNYIIGSSNTISSTGGFNICLGNESTISGTATNAMSILSGRAEGVRSFAKGSASRAFYFNGETKGGAYAPNGNTGTVQTTQLIASNRQSISSGGTFQLYLDGATATQLIIPSNSAGFNSRSWNVQVQWVAAVAVITGTATGVTVGDTKVSTDLLAVRRLTGTTTVSAHTSAGTQVIETVAGSLTASNIAYTAGASQEMAITFTGPTFAGGGSVTMQVVANITITENAFI